MWMELVQESLLQWECNFVLCVVICSEGIFTCVSSRINTVDENYYEVEVMDCVCELGLQTFHTCSVHISHLQHLRLYNSSMKYPLLPAILVTLVLTFLTYMMHSHNGRHCTSYKCCIRNLKIVWPCLMNTNCKKLRSHS